ncbi:phosphatidylserine/phosphatidylglycerophosphate/cardiolipin synthase-like enzyme [Stackebrandtia endophytica]|uniref:phospholipase D n=1 Tax=Stackebrandtia endophytica TaxID=1496996 RepID=A0A543B2D7_9ACTN|nr:phospholipase D-like domain-containing protein [Stackebrandtia endophytica]TQL78976.1 phosphatidylserine/phosphatidylglycerophosphate/cardiolipin synthase-like enzyme [Stackebrandtia endophytica]
MSHSFARRGLVTVLGVALALIAGLTPAATADQTRAAPSAAAQCTTSDRYTMCTTDPRLHPDGKDLTIVEEFQRRIQATGTGARIQIAMYEWTLKRVADDLVAAKNRGVTVQVVIGRNDGDPTRNDEVIAILRGGDIPVTQCADACLPNRDGVKAGAMHNKFMLIEDAGVKTVVQTSTNLTVGQVQKFQNLVATEGDNGLFDYYRGYWNRMNIGSWTYDGVTWNNADRSRKGDHDLSKAYLLPVTAGDPIAAALNNVTECRASNEDDRIWVSHSIFERPAVRERLIELHNMGCDVKVVVGSAEGEAWVEQTVPGKGKLSASKVRSLPGNHNKFIVIDAKYAGQWRKVVFTGSHNISGNSLTNANDAMLRVINSAVVNVYIHYFRDLYL